MSYCFSNSLDTTLSLPFLHFGLCLTGFGVETAYKDERLGYMLSGSWLANGKVKLLHNELFQMGDSMGSYAPCMYSMSKYALLSCISKTNTF